MYIPNHFSITDQNIINEFIRSNGFATLISNGKYFPLATHIPIELETNNNGEGVLRSHLAKANPQWHLFARQPEVKVIFMSDLNHYISSSWYTYKDAPTWNYMSVHISGNLKIMDRGDTTDAIKRLTQKYEQPMKCPLDFDALPPRVMDQIKGVVGFEIEILKVEAAFKMSQNMDLDNFNRIINNLNSIGDLKSTNLARIMVKIREGEF